MLLDQGLTEEEDVGLLPWPEDVQGELDVHDRVRQYGVILNWGTGELLPDTTTEYRAMLKRRSADFWRAAGQASERTPK